MTQGKRVQQGHTRHRSLRTSWPVIIKYIAVILASLVLSLGSILRAAHHRDSATNAGRGGALTVALAFLILFLRPDYGVMLFKVRTSTIPAAKSAAAEFLRRRGFLKEAVGSQSLDQRTTKGFEDLNKVNQSGQRFRDYVLAGVSVLGTLAWGFGDLAVVWVQDQGPCWLFYCWLRNHGPSWLF